MLLAPYTGEILSRLLSHRIELLLLEFTWSDVCRKKQKGIEWV
jgi:hypothetical protein